LSCAAFGDAVRPRGGAPPRQAKGGMAAERQERFCQGVIFGACRPTAQAGDHPDGVDRQQQMAACIPAQPVAPADIGHARQPARATALGMARGDAGVVQRFLWTRRGGQQRHQRQKTRTQRRIVLAHLAVALLPRRQPEEGRAQMPLGRARNPACTAQAWPLATEGHGHPRAARAGRRWPRGCRQRQRGRAKIVHHDVPSRQEGGHIHHSIGSLSWRRERHATGERHLPFYRCLLIHTKRLRINRILPIYS
jgi:hypothetical protein